MDITGISAVAGFATNIINKIWPDKSEQEKAELVAAVQVVMGQMDINKVEAANPSVFVSGWRPFIGWVCGSACAWNWIGLPVAKVGLGFAGIAITLNPADLSEMMPVLMGMLGLGALRTYEKTQKVARP